MNKIRYHDIRQGLDSPALNEIKRLLKTDETYRNYRLGNKRKTITERREEEEKFKRDNPTIHFITLDGYIEVKMSFQLRCCNCYYRLSVMIKEGKKTTFGNILTLQNLYNNE